jgi:hypothetical protein
MNINTNDFTLVARRGDTIDVEVPVVRNNVAVDITGATFKLSAKRWLTDTVPLFQKSGGAVSVPTPSNGIAIITIAPADTSSFTDDTILHCDIEMTETNGKITTVAKGVLHVLLDVG